ncbi:MAG: hypothetical protein FWG57_08580 [Endomicrobia bacterium]|nr:hypothetical protein [Endomicrobiia bacterium]
MKKILLALLLCFAVSGVFAMTAEEVLRKSGEKDLLSNLNFKSYEVEYELVFGQGMSVIMRETVDGTNRRMEAKSGGYVHASFISTDEADYVSVKFISSEGETVVFRDYQEAKSTSTVAPFNKKAAQQDYLYSHLNITFDPSHSQNKKEYVINMSVKDPEKIRKEIKRKRENKEEVTPEEFALSILSLFDSKIFLDRNTLLTNVTQIKFAEEEIYRGVSESDEYKDKSEEEKRKIAKELADNAESFAKIIYSGYKQVEGTKLFYPSEMTMQSPLLQEYYADGVYAIFKINSFKVLNSGEIGPSAFVPTNIKKGKGKVPKEFSMQPDIYGEMIKQMKREITKSLKEALKESVKEGVKEGAKDALKDGAKSVFKGLGKF